MEYSSLALVLLFIGFAMMVAEVFIPSGGILGIACSLTFASSIYCGYRAWYVASPSLWWSYMAFVVIMIPTTIVGAFQFLERSPLGKRILLTAPKPDEVAPYQEEVAILSGLVGQVGRAATLLNPGGMVEIASQRLHSISEGLLIAAGENVEIIAVRGTRVVVRKTDRSIQESVRLTIAAQVIAVEDAEQQTTATATNPPPLDFDVPEV